MAMRMRTGLVFAVLCLTFAGRTVPALAEETAYLTYLPDVPLLPGMEELDGQSIVFDKEEGRVVEAAVFAGEMDPKGVEAFYRRALPALGWKEADSLRFLRNGEQLIVKWEKKEDGVVVTFSLSPKPTQMQEKNF